VGARELSEAERLIVDLLLRRGSRVATPCSASCDCENGRRPPSAARQGDAFSHARRRSSIGRLTQQPQEAEVATKKQKARAAGAGTNLPAKAKPKKKTSRGK